MVSKQRLKQSGQGLLLVSPKPPPNGGIGHWTLLLTSWLQSQNEFHLHHVDTSPKWRGVSDLRFFRRLFGGSIQGARDALKVLVELITFRPSVMHLTTSGGLAGMRDIVILVMSRICCVHAVYHIHFGRLPNLRQSGGWEWFLLNRAMRLSNVVIVIDRTTLLSLKSLDGIKKLELVPNGIITDRLETGLAPLDGSIQTVFFLGWGIPTKGLDELVDAWNEVSQPDWELVVSGPIDDQYRGDLLRRANAPSKITFTGEVSHAEGEARMLKSEIFVLPSHTEGFPYVILEAMAAGRAIVATRVGAIPEMLDEVSSNPCGLLVEPKCSKLLAQALFRLIRSPELRREFGFRARDRVKKCYEAKFVFQRYTELWSTGSVVSREPSQR